MLIIQIGKCRKALHKIKIMARQPRISLKFKLVLMLFEKRVSYIRVRFRLLVVYYNCKRLISLRLKMRGCRALLKITLTRIHMNNKRAHRTNLSFLIPKINIKSLFIKSYYNSHFEIIIFNESQSKLLVFHFMSQLNIHSNFNKMFHSIIFISK